LNAVLISLEFEGSGCVRNLRLGRTEHDISHLIELIVLHNKYYHDPSFIIIIFEFEKKKKKNPTTFGFV
jgi:hypothetical protein